MKYETKRKLAKAIVWLAAGYILASVFAHFAYPYLLFPAPSGGPIPTREDEGAELVELPRDGGPTRGFFIPPRDPNGSVVVMFHGNGETFTNDAFLGHVFRVQLGLGVLAVEYRGYGVTYGPKPTETTLFEDGEAAVTFLKSKGIGPERTILYGYSLGTSVAAEMAVRGHGSKLVLLAPFTSIVDMAYRYAPILPMSLAVTDRLDTYGRTDRILVPTLVMHGDHDEIVPFAQGEKVASRIKGVHFERVSGARHTNLLEDPRAYRILMDFLGGSAP